MKLHRASGISYPAAGCLLLAAVCVAIWAQDAHAVPASPGASEMTQPDGRKIQVRLRGDEYFSWHETEAGYAVARDPIDGFWKYARPSAKAAAFDVVPGARVGVADPAALRLTRHATPNREKLREHLRKAHEHVKSPPETVAAEPTEADQSIEPPPAEIPVAGTLTIRNVVILACFSDHWNSGAGTVSSTYGRTATSEYDNLFNQVNHTTDGAVGSVRDYYYQVSYGKLTIQTIVTPWVVLPNNEAYYGTDGATNDTNWKIMVSDAINAADAAGFDFSQGDSDGDGWVDCLTIIHSGHAQEYSGAPSTNIWSKQGELTSVVTRDGVNMKMCHTEAALRGITSTYIVRIGVICHEMGHFFGLPDLYDYSDTTEGLGNWCLMAGGSWNGSDGKSPSHLCAWSKYMLGFVKPIQVHSSALSLPIVETNPVVHMIRDGMANDEYILVENRAKTGFDNATEIYPGILIEHVDAKSANNDLATWPHPVVKVEEADGDNSLGSKAAGSESGDVWTSTNGLAGGFRDQTGNINTNSMMYQAGYYSRSDNASFYSYNLLNGFSAAGNPMTYTATTLRPTVASQTVTSPDYTVSWNATTNASQYELQEGSAVTLTSFSDGAESADDMYSKWHLSGTVTRNATGSHSGSYCYAMQRLYNSIWYSNVQSLTMQTPFKVTASTVISFYLLSHLSSGSGYLKCQISNDGGDTWRTLGTYAGYTDPWELRSYNYAAISAAGISLNDMCLIRFVMNVNRTSGWTAFPGYGYAIDDISITGTEMSGYGGWTTLSSAIGTTSYPVTGRANGAHVYQSRAFANGVWQGFGSVGTTTVDAQFTVNFQTDGTPGASLGGTLSQTVPSGGACTAVTANAPFGYHLARWTLGGSPYATANPLTVVNVTSNMTLVAVFELNQYTLNYLVSGNGYLFGNTTQTISHGGSGTAVTASPGSGSYFYEWSDGSIINPRTDTNVTGNMTIYANFLDYAGLVWVDFLNAGVEDGSQTHPFDTVAEGINGATSGGTVRILAGTAATPIRITKPLRIEAFGGTVTLGQ